SFARCARRPLATRAPRRRRVADRGDRAVDRRARRPDRPSRRYARFARDTGAPAPGRGRGSARSRRSLPRRGRGGAPPRRPRRRRAWRARELRDPRGDRPRVARSLPARRRRGVARARAPGAIVEIEARDGSLAPRGGPSELVLFAAGMDAVTAATTASLRGIRDL